MMLRLLILIALGVAIGLLIVKLFSKKKDYNVIDREVVDSRTETPVPSLFPVLLLGTVLVGIALFILPRFGISVMGLLQKALAFLPLIRGFLPF